MDPIYEEFREFAEEMLAEFGADATLVKPGEKTGPENRPVIGPPTRHPIRVFRLSKTVTSATDPRLTVTKNSFLISTVGRHRIEEGDSIETDDRSLLITGVKEIAPTFLTILWNVQVGG